MSLLQVIVINVKFEIASYCLCFKKLKLTKMIPFRKNYLDHIEILE